MSDDFVMTIDDDDTIIVEEVMEEPVEQEETPAVIETKSNKKNKKNKKEQKSDKKRKAPTDEEEDFNTEFTFAIDGGGAKAFKGGDFTAAKDMLKAKQVYEKRYSVNMIYSYKQKGRESFD